ncbi:hypothetical protein SBADM41S_07888 [Streptomyces badius]
MALFGAPRPADAGLVEARVVRKALRAASEGEPRPLDGLADLASTELLGLRRLVTRRGTCWTGMVPLRQRRGRCDPRPGAPSSPQPEPGSNVGGRRHPAAPDSASRALAGPDRGRGATRAPGSDAADPGLRRVGPRAHPAHRPLGVSQRQKSFSRPLEQHLGADGRGGPGRLGGVPYELRPAVRASRLPVGAAQARLAGQHSRVAAPCPRSPPADSG